MNKKYVDKIISIVMIVLLFFIFIVGIYLYVLVTNKIDNKVDKSSFNTRIIDTYNYLNSYPTIVKNTNKGILGQYSNIIEDTNRAVSQLTIQAMMYNECLLSDKQINSLFQMYNNGFSSWEKASKIFDNITIYSNKEMDFTSTTLNKLLSEKSSKKVNLLDSKDDEEFKDVTEVGLYYKNLCFDGIVYDSNLEYTKLRNLMYCANTKNLDLYKLNLKDENKSAIILTLKENIKGNVKDYLTELDDMSDINWYTKDTELDIYNFNRITSGIPGSILNDFKANMTDWLPNFNNLYVITYIEFCGQEPIIDSLDTTNDIDSEIEEEIAIENTYAETVNLKDNYVLLIQDNNTKIIECICDVE